MTISEHPNTISDPAKPPRRSRRMLLLVATGALVVGGLAGAAGFGLVPSHHDVVRQAVPGVREIVVVIDGGIVRLRRGAGPDVQVRTTTSGVLNSGPVLGRRVEGGVLTLTAECPDIGFGCRTDQELDIPAGTAVRVQAGAAAVEAIDIDTPSFDVQTGAGPVSASFATAPDSVRVETAAGPVSLHVPDGRYAITAEAVVGPVHVGVADDPSAVRKIDAHTVAGPIEVLGR